MSLDLFDWLMPIFFNVFFLKIVCRVFITVQRFFVFKSVRNNTFTVSNTIWLQTWALTTKFHKKLTVFCSKVITICIEVDQRTVLKLTDTKSAWVHLPRAEKKSLFDKGCSLQFLSCSKSFPTAILLLHKIWTLYMLISRNYHPSECTT